MGEPFKEGIDQAAVARIRRAIEDVHPAFPADAFVASAVDGLNALELKDRVRHVAAALRASLPTPWKDALAILEAAAPPERTEVDGLTEGFAWWPVLQVIETHGLETPVDSLRVLRRWTSIFSAEFAVRPYLVAHPEIAWPIFDAWTQDANPHVRRLASEGSRSRLPWGIRLQDSVRDPSRGLAIVERLRDDPERYVQRSVANHLNDIAKDHPDRVVEVGAAWGGDTAPEGRQWIVRHALRTLLKQGHPGALALIGLRPALLATVELVSESPVVDFGTEAIVAARLTSAGASTQRLRVDWVVHYVKKRGTSPKVFRGTEHTLERGAALQLRKTLPMRRVSTRVHRPGVHRVVLRINGQDLAETSFELRGGDAV